MKKSHLLLASIPLAVMLIGFGCSTLSSSQPLPSTAHKQSLKANQTQDKYGEIEETTASLNQLPSFLDQAAPKIKLAYQAAAQNEDLLRYIPCYCGCGISEGHKNNLDCFIKGKTADGKIIWIDHSVRCDTCMNIALEAAEMKKQGKSPTQIRQAIDNKYKEGYAKPTPTPMPPMN